MAFDQTTRKRLEKFVGVCRGLLVEEFTRQLQLDYGLDPATGRVTEGERSRAVDANQEETGRILRELMGHYLASGGGDDDKARQKALDRIVREQAFTVLNRLCAIRMAEARGFVVEAVAKGYESKGFQLYVRVSGTAVGEAGDAYRHFLFSLFDECAVDLPVLFDRFSPHARLFPKESVLRNVLDEINYPEIEPLWAEDETIGWIYQYYNDPDERKKMRDPKQGGSAAPRNSRELAVRNQFFTPRYVVQFLTDNTLGRIWHEMTKGETALKDCCQYLVRRPTEVFLKPGEEPPAAAPVGGTVAEAVVAPPAKRRPARADDKQTQLDLASAPTQETVEALATAVPVEETESAVPPPGPSQEELLRQPVFIPHRPLKDPRTILMLDPACGSMHFGLYAFDLYEVIYAESWDLEETHGAGALSRPAQMKSLHEVYATKDEFLKDVPRLIIEHNIHGIDIDPRCAQIAGLSLWLRAHRAWQGLGLKPAVRPRIKRSNVVCAEPMPGEKGMLRDFVERHFPVQERSVFLGLLETIFEKMQLAGEAGSLLKIEEEIRGAVDTAREAWVKLKSRPAELFSTAELNAVRKQAELDTGPGLDSLTADFWITAENRLLAALRQYSEQAENGGGFQRRLFAADTVRGFAFIDVCRKRYDVALMNPPFGDASLPSKTYIDENYGDTKGDVYKAFVECFHTRLVPAGYLGIISSRTGFFLGQSEDWRTRVVLRLFRPIALADLGSGVLDAMVEVAAYVLRSLSVPEARELTHSIVPVLEKVDRDRQDRFSLPKWQAARDGLKRHQAVAELEHLETHGFIQRSPGDSVRYSPYWGAVKAVSSPPVPVFPPLVCIRALEVEDKGAMLADAVRGSAKMKTFVCDPAGFLALPGRTFGYWVSQNVRQLFVSMPLFRDSSDRLACITNPAGDDTRYFRCFWEPPAELLGRTKQWALLAKGGEFSRYYSDQHLVVNWDNMVGSYSGFLGTLHRPLIRPASSDNFFRPGFTYSRRSQKGFSVRALPAETIFHDKGPGIFAPESELLPMLAVLNSSVYSSLLALQMSFGSYEVGVVQRTPMPRSFGELAVPLATLALRAYRERRSHQIAVSTSHVFVLPALLTMSGSTLAERATAWAVRVRTSEEAVAAIQTEIDDLTVRLYGLDAADRGALTATLATEATSADDLAGDDEEEEAVTADASTLAADLLPYTLGAAYGLWDIRYAIGARTAPEPSDPFAALPICPPGQLQNDAGLPAARKDIPADYPIPGIPWDGILVDDPNNPRDIERRIRQVFGVIWKDRTDAIEHEACDILHVKTLREFFAKPAAFFADHLKRYSKSRRQAPIYWPLSTSKGSYTLWLYYHRLSDQTLYTCLNEFVEPKLKQVSEDSRRLRSMPARSSTQEEELGELTDLEAELKDFRDELLRLAKVWKPNLNDGVLITAAPLWKLFLHRPWRAALKEAWEKLEAGEYDWAHLALSIWPERVVKASHKDRSFAIAHDLEDDLWEEVEIEKKTKGGKVKKVKVWQPKALTEARLNEVVAAVKAR